MSIVSIEEFNSSRLRSMAEDVACGVETLHFLIYHGGGEDMVQWAADRLADRTSDLRALAVKVHPDLDDQVGAPHDHRY